MDPIDAHPAAIRPEKLLAECEVRRLRRGGPGGQRRNKVETAISLRHRSTGVCAEANERRSQAENQRIAVFRLRVNMAIQIRRRGGQDEEPSPLWQSRCRDGRIHVNPSHEDFPTLLAEALDLIAASEHDVQDAAKKLGCTASQLIKLLKQEPRAIGLVNQWRQQQGLRRLQ